MKRYSLLAFFSITTGLSFLIGNIAANSSTEASKPLSILSVKSAAAMSTEVWWPTNGAHISGAQPFKAMVSGQPLNTYSMSWQVDGGQRNPMFDSYTDTPHKEAMVDVSTWNWRGNGPYHITFAASNGQGQDIASMAVDIYTPNNQVVLNPRGSVTPIATAPTPIVAVITAPIVTTPAPAPTVTASSYNATQFYVDPNSGAATWLRSQSDRSSSMAQAIQKIANQPQALWFGGWNNDVRKDVANAVNDAASKQAVLILVAYNIPQRDCGGYSAGGVNSADGYRSWIKSFADGIGSNRAMVVLEPDSLANIDCLNGSDQSLRFQLLREAVNTLKSRSNKVSVYIDAGHPGWQAAAVMADRLSNAGVSNANGFSLNVSNFVTTADNTAYGQAIASRINKHFIIDTSRNGSGPAGSEWFNPN